MNTIKSEIKLHDIPVKLLFYFILIPFVYPKGFASFFSVYKLFFTVWLLAALAVIVGILVWIGMRRQLRLKRCLYWIIAYFAVFLLITLGVQRGLNDGLQKLFAAPLICLFTMEAMKEYKYTYISCLANILLVEFILALTVCSPIVMGRYFSEASHMLFMGHVQVASQFGIMGVLLSYFLYRINRETLRPGLLFATSMLLMATSGTVASLIAIMILLCGLIFCRFRSIRWLACQARLQFWFYILLNIVLFIAAIAFYGTNYKFGRLAFDLNGRMYIWNAALHLLNGHWIIGYGAYGIQIYTWWNTATSGMNYAHNQLMQCLLDGGTVLTLLFFFMVYACINQMGKTKRSQMYVPCVCLFCFLMIMLIESMTEYLYFYIFLIMMAYLPEITSLYKKPKYRFRIEW